MQKNMNHAKKHEFHGINNNNGWKQFIGSNYKYHIWVGIYIIMVEWQVKYHI